MDVARYDAGLGPAEPVPRWKWAVTAGVLGWVLDAFDFFVVVFLFDTLAAHFHTSKASVVYTLTLTLIMRPFGALAFGALADRYGRKRPLIACVLYFSTVTVLSGLAPTIQIFAILRALYGFGMGGYWGIGASYAMESAPVRLRGILSGVLQGGYPAGYLRRVRALFPEKKRTLHLFSGRVDLTAFPGDTVDLNASLRPTFVDDAQSLETVPLDKYDLVLADPPYSVEDANHYQTTMIKRNVVMRALQGLKIGSHVVWLDQVLPMDRKDAFAIDAAIGMWKSTNHRFRGLTIFRRIGSD